MPQAVSYNLKIGDIVYNNISSTTYTNPKNTFPNNSTILWAVQAQFSNNQTSPWSNNWGFTGLTPIGFADVNGDGKVDSIIKGSDGILNVRTSDGRGFIGSLAP